MKKLFGTDGIRGIVGGDLTEGLAESVGRSLIDVLKENQHENIKVLIGMDTRLSSPDIAASLAKGICHGGADAIIVGVCSTPAVAYLVQKRGYNAGVMVSASHNPYEYNGIKIFGSDGFKISDEYETKIEERVDKNHFSESDKTGKIINLFDGVDDYINYLVDSFSIPLSGIRLGIDCANGSASVSAEKIFSKLGAECHTIFNNPNGTNINKACGSLHLDGLKALVINKKLDLGIAFDGDGDRCIAIDETGNEVDGDRIMAILSLWMKENNLLLGNSIVGTVMSNIGLINFCRENGINFISTKVGDRFVLERMNLDGFSLGGEQSGHIILRKYATTGDGQLTALALLTRIKSSGKVLSTLAAVMKKYPQYMVNIEASPKEKQTFLSSKDITALIKDAETMLPNGRLLIRPSGTEPLIRIMAEGENQELIKNICNKLSEKIKFIISSSDTSVG